MSDRTEPPSQLEVRLLAAPEPDLGGALASAGLQCIGRFGVAEVWVPMPRIEEAGG